MRRAALLLVAALLPWTAAAQEPVALFNGRNLDGWRVEHAEARVRNGAIRLGASRGWVRTALPYADFVLTLEVRMADRGGSAAAFLRAWPTFDKDSRPNNAYRLSASSENAGASTVVLNEPATPPAWKRWQIECVGRSVRLHIDGVLAYTFDGIENSQGFIGLSASGGTVEFRHIEIRESSPDKGSPPPGVATVGSPGVAIPKLLKEVKPAYTAAAMAALIQGTAWLTVVVEADGSVGAVRIVRSLDRQFGLDREAVIAAQQWRFSPGTLDGTPTRVLVTISLTFTLK